MKKKYCEICGKKLKKGKVKGLNELTGKKKYEMYCVDENTCSHGEHIFGKRYKTPGGSNHICERCGKHTFMINPRA